MPEIDPDRLYSITQACQFLPSPYGNRTHLDGSTLRRWIRLGLVAAERRCFRGRFYFVRGSELLRLLEPPPELPPIQSAAQRRRQMDKVDAQARALGLI